MLDPLKFIELLRNAHPDNHIIYTRGSCFEFYRLFKSVFVNAMPYHSSAIGHVIVELKGKYYDIRGEYPILYVMNLGYTPMDAALQLSALKWAGSNVYRLSDTSETRYTGKPGSERFPIGDKTDPISKIVSGLVDVHSTVYHTTESTFALTLHWTSEDIDMVFAMRESHAGIARLAFKSDVELIDNSYSVCIHREPVNVLNVRARSTIGNITEFVSDVTELFTIEFLGDEYARQIAR